MLLQLKKPEEAVGELEEALRLDPQFLDARLALGLAEGARGRTEPARAALQEVQKTSPASLEAKEAGEALSRLGGGAAR
jgi:tetratricopeptide (TPR) repeat protein